MYGTSWGGPHSSGTVFRVDATGAFSTVHGFNPVTDGVHARLPLVLARDGALYGVNQGASTNNVVYRIDSTGAFTSFQVIPASFYLDSPLVQGSDCALYGIGINTSNYTTMLPNFVVYRVFEPRTLCQQIKFAPLPDRRVGDPPFTVSATASSGLPVSFSASGRCRLSGDQVFLKRGVGVCRVTAYQGGDSRFAPAEDATQEFRVWPPRRRRSLR